MSVKWKIFFALNIVLGLLSFILLMTLLVFFFTSGHTNEDYLYFTVFLFALSIMTLNAFLNIFVLQRYYPDKLIPVGAKRLTLILFILTILIAVGLLLVCIAAAGEEFGRHKNDTDPTGKIALGVMALATLLQVIILAMQGQLPRLIRRNHQNSMHSLIDSIGQTTTPEN